MKATKNVAKKTVANKTAPPASKTDDKVQPYTVVLDIGGVTYTSHGEDYSIFSGLKPTKVLGKCLFTLTNNENKKSYVMALPPLLARKIVAVPAVQQFQWKRMSAKVA